MPIKLGKKTVWSKNLFREKSKPLHSSKTRTSTEKRIFAKLYKSLSFTCLYCLILYIQSIHFLCPVTLASLILIQSYKFFSQDIPAIDLHNICIKPWNTSLLSCLHYTTSTRRSNWLSEMCWYFSKLPVDGWHFIQQLFSPSWPCSHLRQP